MSKKEISDSFKAFKKEAGGSKIKVDKFTKLVAGMNTNAGNKMLILESQYQSIFSLFNFNWYFLISGGNVTEYAKHLFRVLDTDKDNMVSFQEVMLGFHHLSSSGDERERMKMVFQVSKQIKL